MREEKRAAKRAMIAEAAYALIEERGYAGTSMLAVAKAAKASNETLYNWYGDKQGLFRALVEANADEVAEALALIDEEQPPLATLKEVGAQLLLMLLGERAVALNRAAAADPTGELGQALAQGGRARVAPLISRLLAQAGDSDMLSGAPQDLAETYFTLLIGDAQIRRVTHVTTSPSQAECASRASRAVAQLACLFPPR